MDKDEMKFWGYLAVLFVIVCLTIASCEVIKTKTYVAKGYVYGPVTTQTTQAGWHKE